MSRRAYGSGSIREIREGYYELRVSAPSPLAGGRPRQISRGFRGSRKGAQQALARLVSEVGGGRHVATEGTVAMLMERWLAHVEPRLAESTMRRYEIAARSHIIPVLGDVELRKLAPTDLDRLYRRMERAGDKPASVRKVHQVMRSALRQAVRWRWVHENVATDASPPPVRTAEVRPPTTEEVRTLLAAAEKYSPEFGAFAMLAVTTGCRRGELCALRWCDVDLEDRSALIGRSVTASGAVKDTKTHRVRRIALGAETARRLADYRLYCEARAARALVDYGDDAYLFSGVASGARPWVATSPTSMWAAVRRSVGLDHVRLHDLRHGAVTTQLAGGIPVLTVAGRAGHGDGRTTQAVYGHFLAASDRTAAALMDQVLGPDATKPPVPH